MDAVTDPSASVIDPSDSIIDPSDSLVDASDAVIDYNPPVTLNPVIITTVISTKDNDSHILSSYDYVVTTIKESHLKELESNTIRINNGMGGH